jgi:hypothetical protein
MKKEIIVLTAALLLTASTMFAQEARQVPSVVVNELHKEFKDISDLQWKTVSELYKATFTVDGSQREAFFSADGSLTALSRKLSIDQLPLALVKEVKEKATTYGIADLFELLTDNGTEYFLEINNGKQSKRYRSDGYGWIRY